MSSIPAKSLRVLVVDDELIIRELLAEVLAEAGCQVTTARDGRHALTELPV